MIPALEVMIDGESTIIEPDVTGLVFAEMALGVNYDQIPELALRLCLAFYHGPHRCGPGFERWERIHAWGMGTRVEIAMTD